ncbi:MAG TPA: hypothetical protein VFG47_23225 [Geminicoccaceae bacterium]|nr:hypothetical protein [Geminicoccaceae bacterium]
MATVGAETGVAADGSNTAEADRGLPSGDAHRAMVSAAERAGHRSRNPFPVFHVGPWPDDLPLRREELYGDDGR